ncbi:YfjI family protein [Mycobacterium sp. SMC-4]|uniref:YfjI family protein n=1 Tax=Mycobacterium sp. SMC-4 TaxID=2857059 RepID=UPI0021B1C3FF|nr:YfjI family protein [Mycobacterium sp. SMC-4]UXA16976.1 DUF3987 domain-containing protein [Mycobacterium sp. SMC-4]
MADAPKGDRNTQLFRSAANLYELVAAGALDETDVYSALRDACRANLLEQEDGEKSVTDTIASARRRGFDNPRDLSNVGTRARAGGIYADHDDEPEPLRFNDFQRLERGFWTERESLQTIYLAALSRMCSPWPVLAHCVAIALAMLRPHIVLPPLIGGRGSLNWFGVVAAPSGATKSASESVAHELVRSTVRRRNLGSGEGFLDAYTRPANKETGEPAGLHESVLFVADEGDSLQVLGSRKNATLSSTLRSAFTGAQIGFSYRTNDLHLPAHSYRTVLVINIQPAKAGVLLDDRTGGLLQRFMWFPGVDQRVSRQAPPWPGPLVLPSPAAWQYPKELAVPFEAVEMIRDAAERQHRDCDEHDNLDAHALFVREKFAFALAVLDGRDEMTPDDWRLAGVAARVSTFTRDYVTQEVDRATVTEARKRGRTRGVEFDAANDEQSRQGFQRRRRLENWVVGKLREAGSDGVTEGTLRRRAAGRDQPHIAKVLLGLAESGEVRRLDPQPGERTVRWTLNG